MGKRRGMSEDVKISINNIIRMYSPEEPVEVSRKIYVALEREGLVPDERVVVVEKIPV